LFIARLHLTEDDQSKGGPEKPTKVKTETNQARFGHTTKLKINKNREGGGIKEGTEEMNELRKKLLWRLNSAAAAVNYYGKHLLSAGS
jgi:hypothetical protein